jgi:two-component system phosphate regulon sensor histidine kinase PhoR
MTRKSKGTGLGLYIVKFLVEQHNGRIELKANEPQGSIVHIEFKK